MNQAHIHLLSNHFPVIGPVMGLIALAVGMAWKSAPARLAAYLIFIVSGLGAIVAFTSGEGAEHIVKTGLTVSKEAVDRHGDFADYGFAAIMALAAASVFGALESRIRIKVNWPWDRIVFILAIITLALCGWTAYLGGKIRHTEFNDSASSLPPCNPSAG